MVKTEVVQENHYERIRPGMFEMRFIGGPDRLRAIQAAMEAAEAELEPCPFCGAPAVIYGTFAYANPAVVARCSCCRCTTPLRVGDGSTIPSGRAETLEDRIAEAAELWNRRVAG